MNDATSPPIVNEYSVVCGLHWNDLFSELKNMLNKYTCNNKINSVISIQPDCESNRHKLTNNSWLTKWNFQLSTWNYSSGNYFRVKVCSFWLIKIILNTRETFAIFRGEDRLVCLSQQPPQALLSRVFPLLGKTFHVPDKMLFSCGRKKDLHSWGKILKLALHFI